MRQVDSCSVELSRWLARAARPIRVWLFPVVPLLQQSMRAAPLSEFLSAHAMYMRCFPEPTLSVTEYLEL